MLNNKHRLWT